MKKILAALCLMMSLPTLTLAAGQNMISVSELHRQAEEMAVAKDLCHAERRTERGYPDSCTGCGEMPGYHGGKRPPVYPGDGRRDAENCI